jgi:hypothetical protein
VIPADLQDPDQWEGAGAVTPPLQWEFIAADERWWWVYSSAEGDITFLGDDPILASEDTVCHWEVTEILGSPATTINIRIGDLAVQAIDGTQLGSGSFAVPTGTDISSIGVESDLGGMYDATIALNFTGTGGDCEINCACEEESDNLTLAEYRQKLLIRAGFAAVASNPPPGVAELFNTFLQDAQEVLYRKYPALETRRFFHWDLVEGQRFYGLRDDTKEGCLVNLEPYKTIEGAWLSRPRSTRR